MNYERQGKFIAFEGIDGSGKTTQAKMLADYLCEMGYDVVLTREPGGIPETEPIRALIMNPKVNTDPNVALFLFLADRARHIPEIKSDLEKGKIVICDRFETSTLVYQGHVGGLSLPRVRAENEIATGGLRPDLILIIDLPAEEAKKRAKREDSNHYDEQPLEFYEKLKEGFLREARALYNAGICQVIDGTGTPEEIHQRIIDVLRKRGIIDEPTSKNVTRKKRITGEK